MTPLEALRKRLEELRSQITTKRTRGTEILSMAPDQLTSELTAEATQLRSDLVGMRSLEEQLVEQIRDEEAAEARQADARSARAAAGTTEVPEARNVGGARVTNEERTYSLQKTTRGETSFFSDAFNATQSGDMGAQQRLARHAREVEVEGELKESRATTTASYAGLVVPQYLVDMFAPVLRNGRPLANRVNRLPLPAQGMTLNVPRGTTGAAAASQATQNSALQNTDQVWADLVVPVVTIGGQQDVSRQSLERGTPGMDTIVYMDLARAHNAEVDRQVAAGSGASGQMLGILNTAGIYQASAYTAAATAATFYSKTAGAVAAVAGAGTEIQPNFWVMHPRRWYWLTSLLDSSGRPLAVPNANGAMNALAINTNPGGYSADSDADPPQVVGTYHGLPVIIDANMPTAVGSGPEDQALVADSTKAYLWEDNGGVPRQLKFEQTLGQNLTIKLVLFNYAAFTAGRYPTAFGVTGGNSAAGFGQIAPVF
ncbi:phage major capsid protein [Paractinoplanes atraurantiacus]|uniref:Phage major capsid protein, HK97 family n=1 Tax=Paractinoplanes atraurantiacus TaxID=1036182 RepID=A0A285H0C7_9ACTN|nr:phage major capsid protein [Actinoplanes atraurantiacus]SNY29013.1 phage major capsid protein, HK97 family [Actinoplanes atraurantiacus]